MKNIAKRNLIWFVILATAWLLFTIWVGNYWLLLGIPIIFDIYISKKVNWAFWKKRGVEKHSAATEWLDAIIFAVIAASFIKAIFFQMYIIPTSSMEKELLVGDFLLVSKLSYGTRMPITPLSIPFTHHTVPVFKTKAYSDAIQWKYKRLKGFGNIKRNNIFVFNFPAGDTIVVGLENPDYYAQVRMLAERMKNYDKEPNPRSYYENRARQQLAANREIDARPVDKRENYIKRCVAIAGDTLEIIDGFVYINGQKEEEYENMQFLYRITTKNRIPIVYKNLKKLDISKEDHIGYKGSGILPLTKANADKIAAFPFVQSVEKLFYPKNYSETGVFPFNGQYSWNRDQFGPLVIPQKGQSVKLTINNLSLYERIIGNYEENTLEVRDSAIYINGSQTNTYTFKMNYYWAMGDSRHKSQDSRYWGFVPENHVVGKAILVWMSKDKDKSLPGWIRWKRLFKVVHK